MTQIKQHEHRNIQGLWESEFAKDNMTPKLRTTHLKKFSNPYRRIRFNNFDQDKLIAIKFRKKDKLERIN